MAHFTLPDFSMEIEMEKLKQKVKKFSLMKMGKLFRQWKKQLWATYKRYKKPPKFDGYLPKQKHNWDAFVKYKNSKHAKASSEKNKEKSNKKVHHHKMGRGGYKTAMPKWAEQE